MTLLAGINLGSYVVMGADTRVSWYPPDGTFRFHDEGEKIQKTNIGLITGAGLINILDDVKKQLSEHDDITHTKQLEVMMHEALNRFRNARDWSDQPLSSKPLRILAGCSRISAQINQRHLSRDTSLSDSHWPIPPATTTAPWCFQTKRLW